jgi:DNA-binding NtrC family response regulator
MKIIVVDDEPIIADTLVEILNGEGHEAVAVSNGDSAVRWAGMIKPDLVISDVIMPGMDGVETAKAILGCVPDCRIILFSGQIASMTLLDNARRQGFSFEILAKPVNPDVLLAAINSKDIGAVKEKNEA